MERVKYLEKCLENMENLVDIQCTEGNWDYSEYMRGMANGLLVAQSCFTGEHPGFFEQLPEKSSHCDNRSILFILPIPGDWYSSNGMFFIFERIDNSIWCKVKKRYNSWLGYWKKNESEIEEPPSYQA